MNDRGGNVDANSQRGGRLLEQVALLEVRLRRYARWLVSRTTSPHSFVGSDLVSFTALSLIERRDSLPSEPGRAKRAFGAAMKRALLDSIRRHRVHGDALAQALPSATTSEGASVDMLLDLRAALDTLRALDPEARRLVQLIFFSGMTHAEAAAELGVTERTVRNRWSDVRKLLDHLLERGTRGHE